MHLKHCKSTIHQQNAHIKEKRGTNGQQVHETGLNNDHQEIMTSNLLYCLLLKRGEKHDSFSIVGASCPLWFKPIYPFFPQDK